MERFVGLQTVVTLLCGLEKKYEVNNEKNLRFQQIRVISKSGISKYFSGSYFFVDELQWALILFVSSLSILRMFLLLNWLFSL